ncbi:MULTISPECIES: HAD-IC family P-type ATPase [Comamonas]|uniref:HAD-IC family P-type ATPase n=1 Tax=Comamonas TaxID=283 RepID=UPI00050ED95B|nr:MULTISPECIES: HAD-IC family P-type ATPase [Comamonas]KGG86465.1 carbonate dehydratase [Comamonas thiooxydans]KGG97566.1 carbonate dehydratase [Comamonas thiooxydans]KGG98094.1 carbonate dehydratase [Comamonas thiooxydans]KGH09113.1 carbonate dehydratase [Comamonas thiooxydans]TZG12663.1 HAD-IC family P-type ATPase [Comamonas thiooxydans]
MQEQNRVAAWHALATDTVLTQLQSTAAGLSSGEARERLQQQGPNALPAAASRSMLARFLSQFNNLLIYVLLGSAVVTALLQHWVDTGVILAVVLINAVFGFVQEGRAEKALDAVKAMVSSRANVLRDGLRMAVPAEELVAGDCVLLEAGDRVPADLRLLRASSLKLDEAMLTGESVAVDKSADPVVVDAALGDRFSMAYSGTLVAAGQGLGVVVATGPRTELGQISTMLGSVQTLATPLTRLMDRFARQLTVTILSLSALMFCFALWVRDYDTADAFIAVVGIAVSAIPEGLPVVMTIALAIGVQRMAARYAIVRSLPAVETLGAVSVICSDKTGTLTRNEMSVRAVVLPGSRFDIEGEGYAPQGHFTLAGEEIEPALHPQLLHFATGAALCNDAHVRHAEGTAWTVEGDPMEGALVTLATRAGLDVERLRQDWRRLDEVPFDAVHRYMATLHRPVDAPAVVFVKGAPEQVLAMCRDQQGAEGLQALDAAYWLEQVDALAAKGYRVLGLASFAPEDAKDRVDMADVKDLTLLGVLGMIDPPRESAKEAVHECRSAGIAVKMITGDHAATAAAIARELALADTIRVTSGHELDGLNDAQLIDVARASTVFARTSPEHKLRLVQALQADHSVIAMTGDGVNDAPALKRADIGVAMGITGTAAAKEAAGMVLADDNFATIVAAVKEGRTVYENLRKVIAWTLPTNGGQAIVIVAAILLGLSLPVTPVQILWVNLVTAVALGLTLAFEPPEPTLMQRKPRSPDEQLLQPYLLWRVALVSVLFALGCFGMFEWSLRRGDSVELARTIVVNALVIMEIFYLFSVRYTQGTSLSLRGVLGTPAVLLGVAGVTLVQLLFTYTPPMQALFDSRPVDLAAGLLAIGLGVALLLLLEVEKLLVRWMRLGVRA